MTKPDPTPASPRVSDERLSGLIAMVRAGASTNPLVDNLACDLADCRAELAAVRVRQQRLIDLAREVAEDVETLANAWSDNADDDTLGERIGILNLHTDWMWEHALALAASQPEEAGRE